MPYLLIGLQAFQESMVCTVAVGVVTELCNAIGRDILLYGNEIVNALLVNLQNSNLHRDVKPPIISCFSDVAMAIGGEFKRYLGHVMLMLVQGSQTQPEDAVCWFVYFFTSAVMGKY